MSTKRKPSVPPTITSSISRLQSISSSLSRSQSSDSSPDDRKLLGHLTLNDHDLRLPVYETTDPSRLPFGKLLDGNDPSIAAETAWLMKKWELGQDIFYVSVPGPFARRLALTFLSAINTPFEHVSLHRDIGEGELKQTREIREGGTLVFEDGPVVRAAKEGKTLILEGIERCERGILPILNNLLENREMNLEDGTHIISPSRYDLLVESGKSTDNFIKCHPSFRVIAIGAPVPPFPGLPIDPPFRSRFQSRYIDPVLANKVLSRGEITKIKNVKHREAVQTLVDRLGDVILTLQVQKEMRAKMVSGISTGDAEIPLFPQTSLSKFARFFTIFPPPSLDHSSPTSASNLLGLLAILHPKLSYLPNQGKRALEDLLKSSGFSQWAEGISACDLEKYHQEGGGEGIFGWRLKGIERVAETTAKISFSNGDQMTEVTVPCGPFAFQPWPLTSSDNTLHVTPRFLHLLTSLLQLHSLGNFDLSLVPSSPMPSASSSTSLVISTFASLLGYSLDVVHLYKEIGGRELWMRREVGGSGGVTGWAESALVKGMRSGNLVWLESIDTIGATVGSLSRLFADRQGESFGGKRFIAMDVDGEFPESDSNSNVLEKIHPSFRIITTSSKSTPPNEWLSEELTSNLVSLPSAPMSIDEERHLLLQTGCPRSLVDLMETFATKYRILTSIPGNKSRRLGTGSLIRIAKRLALHPEEDLRGMLERTLLVAFLPVIEQEQVRELMTECGVTNSPVQVHPPVAVEGASLVFVSKTLEGKETRYEIKQYVAHGDPENLSLVPQMDVYLDNQNQTLLMRDIAVDLDMKEHVLLLGNQGVGKNKIIDRLRQLQQRGREYVQLSRDSTTESLLSSVSLEGGVLKRQETPLLRAIRKGRIIVIDEADKAPPNVVAALASLASRGELSLPSGLSVRPSSTANGFKSGDLVLHPNFRLILLANRAGYPFLGNSFLQSLGDNFSTYAVPNPDRDSELAVLSSLAPELPIETLKSLTQAFQDLRIAFEKGTISYPFSLRELLALVRHMKRFPDPLEDTLRNVFDFDVHSPSTLDALHDVLRKYKLGVDKVGIDAVRGTGGGEKHGEVETSKKKPEVVEFEPTGDTSLSEPKFGKIDDEEHTGGNTWAGGTGGRDTAGSGGRGGYMRLIKGDKIKQIPDSLKAQVPEEISDRAREMARAELARKLEDLDLSSSQASTYSRYYDSVSSHIQSLVSFLENLEAKEQERVWLKRQSDGDLDEMRITEGLTGESSIYKRRGEEKPEFGPQMKPKRIRFVFDLSASMYRNQYDGRLARSLEAIVMILEAFSRLSPAGLKKYKIDLVGHSGEEKSIPLAVDVSFPLDAGATYKILAKAALIPQYCFAGDYTLEAIESAVDKVAEELNESDECFVVALSDANFDRYDITDSALRTSLNRNSKVSASLIAIGEGGECEWLAKSLPGKAYRVRETSDLARTLKAILGKMLGGSM
ncbi:uncharacterized protein JCM6883_005995 [Sporobolomyces salmoneus]|uniref:uncharacterized protein n=1 Tax=Sporobolomyces salmoneus TaxID=183962 RepID=UPI0031797D17